MVVIVDYGAGNLMSISKALHRLGADSRITQDLDEILRAKSIILPGVGSFGPAMRLLRETGAAEALRQAAGSGVPVLGICLGMQLMFDGSEEGPGTGGLGFFEGNVRRLPGSSVRIPHLGWNTIESPEGPLFDGVDPGSQFYFAHSFWASPGDPGVVTSHTTYGIRFASSVARGSLFGVQFHPEKSGRTGLALLRNFLGLGGWDHRGKFVGEVLACSSYPRSICSKGSV